MPPDVTKVFSFLVLPFLLGATADTLRFVLPVACSLGRDCAIQNYVDGDASTAASDFRCGGRTYDKHDGIDFRLRSEAEMTRGVAVLAAANGTVVRTRDGVADISVKQGGHATPANIMCGNGVVIEHGGGVETQYCHMAKDSILVQPGQRVSAGAPIGRVGLSGNTEYPHLHFTVREGGKAIDPFAYGAKPGRCGGGRSLWAALAGVGDAYRAGEVLNAGFATGPVSMALVQRYGSMPVPRPTRDAPALVAFVQAIGLEGGDVQRLTVTAPDGSVIGDNRVQPLDRDKAQWVIFAGRKRPPAGWASGRYSAHYTVVRAGKVAIEKGFGVEL